MLKRFIGIIFLALLMVALVACNTPGGTPAATTAAPAATTAATKAAATTTAAPAATTAAPAATTAVTQAAATQAVTTAATQAANNEMRYMFTDEPITLTVFCDFDAKASATLTSYNEMECFIAIAEKTGVILDFQHPPAGQGNELFNLMVASGDYTDLIWRNWVGFPGGPDKAIGDGIIIDVRPLVEEYAPNYLALLNDPRVEMRDVLTDSGKMFYFTFFRLEDWYRHTEGFYVRGDWLDMLNISPPESMDDWYNMLTAMKEYGPFNGATEVVPFAGAGIWNLHRFIAAYGIQRQFYLDRNDGSVKFGSMQPEYKEHVLEMQKWYREGLIDPEIITLDGAGFNARITGHVGGSFGGWLAGGMGTFMGLMQKDPDFQLAGAGWPKDDIGGGVRWNPSGIAHRAVEGAGFGISPTNKNPKESVQVLDYFYSEEGHYLINFGTEGKAYDMINGKPVLQDHIMNDPDMSPVQAISRYGQLTIWFSYIQDPDGFAQSLKYPGVREAGELNAQSDKSLTLPPITPTYEEGQRQAAIVNEFMAFVDESYAEWIINGVSLDNYDAYVQEIERMGIAEAIAIQEAALARYRAR